MTADDVTFTNNTLNPNDTADLTVRADAGGATDTETWSVYASDDSGGAGEILCAGTWDVTIADPGASPPVISNVQAGGLGATSVTVNWTTNVASDSVVAYGTDGSYGKSVTDATQTTSHSVKLTGLDPNTAYHYQVSSTNSAGSSSSGDNTFLTALVQTPIVIQTPVSANVPGVAIKATPTETVPPTVSVVTDLSKPFKAPPLISGRASDNEAVARVEYSVDGGKNWAPVDKIAGVTTTQSTTTGKGKNKKTTTATVVDPHSVSFEFTPVLQDDGNYKVVVRATDASGNQAMTTPVVMVIDRLPPRLGTELVSIGAQAAVPDASGRWRSVVDVDQTVTANAVGGPVTMVVQAAPDGSKRAPQSFQMRQDAATGLWSGVLSFHVAGTYNLTAEAVDGAGNRTSQVLSDVVVSTPARLVAASGGKSVSGAKVTLYNRQARTGVWAPWDGATYGETNPQRSSKTGGFHVLAPAGTYYLKVEAPGYETLVTRSFKLDVPTPLVPVLKLKARPVLKLGSWSLPLPWVALAQTEVRPGGGSAAVKADVVGKSLPAFDLPTTDGGKVSAVGLLGKPTVVSVVSTWAPATSEQLPILQKLRANSSVNVVPVAMGERGSKMGVFLDRAGLDVPVVADADATLSAVLGTPTVPTHYILDRKGKITAVLTGVVSEKRLLDALAGK